jgi:hypothetical protein
VKTNRDADEPLSPDGQDRRSTDAGGLRDALSLVALFAGIVLVGAILGILFIALMQALGLWMAEAAETTFSALDGADELRTSLHRDRQAASLSG